MPLALTFTAPRAVELRPEPSRAPNAGEVRLQTLSSGISHGTEMNVYRGVAPLVCGATHRHAAMFAAVAGLTPCRHRWSVARRMDTVLHDLPRFTLRPLITDLVPFTAAADAYRRVDAGAAHAIQVVLDYTALPAE